MYSGAEIMGSMLIVGIQIYLFWTILDYSNHAVKPIEGFMEQNVMESKMTQEHEKAKKMAKFLNRNSCPRGCSLRKIPRNPNDENIYVCHPHNSLYSNNKCVTNSDCMHCFIPNP